MSRTSANAISCRANNIGKMRALYMYIWFNLRYFSVRRKGVFKLLRFDFRTQISDEYVKVIWK